MGEVRQFPGKAAVVGGSDIPIVGEKKVVLTILLNCEVLGGRSFPQKPIPDAEVEKAVTSLMQEGCRIHYPGGQCYVLPSGIAAILINEARDEQPAE